MILFTNNTLNDRNYGCCDRLTGFGDRLGGWCDRLSGLWLT